MHLRLIFLLMFASLLAFQTQAQASKSFFFPPGLEFDLPEEQWERTWKTYDDAMWIPSNHHLRNGYEDISIQIYCDLIEKLEVHPDSMNWLLEEQIRLKGATFRKETINKFTVYSMESQKGDAEVYDDTRVTRSIFLYPLQRVWMSSTFNSGSGLCTL